MIQTSRPIERPVLPFKCLRENFPNFRQLLSLYLRLLAPCCFLWLEIILFCCCWDYISWGMGQSRFSSSSSANDQRELIERGAGFSILLRLPYKSDGPGRYATILMAVGQNTISLPVGQNKIRFAAASIKTNRIQDDDVTCKSLGNRGKIKT